ncbi:hypothetical protein GEV33_007250 [Tenebrio molitor]|uniref:RNA-directed DNA polymerase n=1 Tax=Tenebrio molitor TaxID=7067 RepID=A0A8J6LJ02_TENMO|nr:hypothetical protein GEV33_007250 [Tenebrio molitor]
MTTLGEHPVICANIKKASVAAIKALHKLIFQEDAGRRNRQKLREFAGFDFNENSEEFQEKMNWIETNLTLADLIAVCSIFNMDYQGNESTLAKRICEQLVNINEWNIEEPDDTEEEAEGEVDSVNEPEDLQASRPRFTMSFRDVEDSIRSFSGEDNYQVETWLSDFEEMGRIMGWSGLQKVVFAKKSLSGLAKLFIQSERGLSTWLKLRSALLDEFSQKINSAELHQTLSKRTMKKEESVQQYLLAMRELASRGSIEVDALIQYVVDGIPDYTNNKMSLYEAKDLKELKTKLDLATTNLVSHQRRVQVRLLEKGERQLFDVTTAMKRDIMQVAAKSRSEKRVHATHVEELTIFEKIVPANKRTTPAESKYHSFELEALAIVYSLERFRVYLQGIRFKIVTDCNSLKLTLERKEVNPRILRWSLILRNYDYVLEHRSADRMKHADALSRNCGILIIEENSVERNLQILQGLDEKIEVIKQKLELSEDKLFELNNGLIYRKQGENLLFYVPKSMEYNVISDSHNVMGHQGVNKTMEYVKRVYWFPELKDKVQNFIKNCLKCITYSPKSGKVEGKLHCPEKEDQGIQLVLIATATPQSNGQIERINRSLTPMLAKLVETTDKWDRLLGEVEFAFNNSVNRSTGVTPSHLLYGTNQIGGTNDNLRLFLEQQQNKKRDFEEIRQHTVDKVHEVNTYNENYYNKHHKPPTQYKVVPTLTMDPPNLKIEMPMDIWHRFRSPGRLPRQFLEWSRYGLLQFMIPSERLINPRLGGVEPKKRRASFSQQTL